MVNRQSFSLITGTNAFFKLLIARQMPRETGKAIKIHLGPSLLDLPTHTALNYNRHIVVRDNDLLGAELSQQAGFTQPRPSTLRINGHDVATNPYTIISEFELMQVLHQELSTREDVTFIDQASEINDKNTITIDTQSALNHFNNLLPQEDGVSSLRIIVQGNYCNAYGVSIIESSRGEYYNHALSYYPSTLDGKSPATVFEITTRHGIPSPYDLGKAIERTFPQAKEKINAYLRHATQNEMIAGKPGFQRFYFNTNSPNTLGTNGQSARGHELRKVLNNLGTHHPASLPFASDLLRIAKYATKGILENMETTSFELAIPPLTMPSLIGNTSEQGQFSSQLESVYGEIGTDLGNSLTTAASSNLWKKPSQNDAVASAQCELR